MSKKSTRKKTTEKSSQNKINIEEDNERVQEYIKTLRKLLEGEENLVIRTDDKFLLRYLRWKEFDPEEAFKKIKEIYKFRAETKDWHCSKPVTEYETLLEMNAQVMLSERDTRGRRVYVTKMGNVDLSNKDLTLQRLSHLDDMWLEVAMQEDETQKNGIAIVVDMAGYSWKMFKWLTPNNMRISSRKLYNLTFPQIDIHVVNTSFLLNASIALVFPFLDSKVKEHIHFHNQDWTALHKHVNPEILPQEYGGDVSNLDYEKMRKLLFDNSDELMDLFSMGYVTTQQESK